MSKIRKSAKMKQCLARIPNCCNYRDETTCHGHLNGAGVGIKHNDILGARVCSSCHAVIDALPKSNMVADLEQARKLLYFYEAIYRTQMELVDEGLIIIK